MQTVILKVTKLLGTPVFTTFSTDMRFSKVYGATRLGDDPLWYYPAFYPVYKNVLRDIRVLKIPLVLSETAEKVVKQLDQYAERVEKRILPPKFEFKTQPYDHQLEGLVHILYNYRAALFYACGLGKTKVVVDWQRAIGAWPLILCPRVVLKVWAFEAQRHGIDQEYAIIDARTKTEKSAQIERAKGYHGMVISYDSARSYYEEIAAVKYTAIVADESHYIKGHTSTRSKVAIELSKKTSRRVIMSGTPSTGDPRDMWAQFRFLAPCLIPEQFWKFKNTYCETAPMNRRIVTGYKNLDVLNRRVNIVALRKTKGECLDLPRRQIIDIPIDLEDHQRKVYNTLIHTEEYDEIRTAMEEGKLFTEQGIVDVPNAAILVNKLLQVACGFVYLKSDAPPICDGCEHLRNCIMERVKPYTARCQVDSTPRPAIVQRMKTNAKLEMLLYKLDEILAEPTHKCIIWAQFKAEMDWVQEAIEKHWAKAKLDHTLVRVDGKVTKPAQFVDQFNEDPKCRIYLGQVETGVGITLNAANYMVYFSLPWKLLAYDQSIDRNHRVGQERDVVVFRLIARKTIDIHVARALATKRTVSETIVAVLKCANCDRQTRCEERDISLFEPGCKYKREVARPVARARSI